MSYDTIRNGIMGRMKALGFARSEEVVDFSGLPAREMGKTYILKAISGAMSEGADGESEVLADRFYDVQQWEIHIAFDKTTYSDVVNYDQMHRKKDSILADLDNPSNWSSFARILKYNSWDIQELDNYFTLIIGLKVVDTVTY